MALRACWGSLAHDQQQRSPRVGKEKRCQPLGDTKIMAS